MVKEILARLFWTQQPVSAPAAPALDLRRFDSFHPHEVLALPRRLRRAVIADRKQRVTARLQLEVTL